MPPQAWGALTAIAIFAVGVIYNAGRVSARLDAIEAWRLEMRADLLQLRAALEEIKDLIRGAEE
jgi:hypothetical protein